MAPPAGGLWRLPESRVSLGLPVDVLVIRTCESSKPSTGDVTSGPSGARRRQHDRMLNGSNGSVWPGRRATGLIGKRGDRGREAPWRSKLGSIKGPLQAPGSRFCRLRTQHMDTGLNGRPIGSVKSEHGPELSGRAPSRTVALPFMVAS